MADGKARGDKGTGNGSGRDEWCGGEREREKAATVREDGEKVVGEGESERERSERGYQGERGRVWVCETGTAIGMPRARGGRGRFG